MEKAHNCNEIKRTLQSMAIRELIANAIDETNDGKIEIKRLFGIGLKDAIAVLIIRGI